MTQELAMLRAENARLQHRVLAFEAAGRGQCSSSSLGGGQSLGGGLERDVEDDGPARVLCVGGSHAPASSESGRTGTQRGRQRGWNTNGKEEPAAHSGEVRGEVGEEGRGEVSASARRGGTAQVQASPAKVQEEDAEQERVQARTRAREVMRERERERDDRLKMVQEMEIELSRAQGEEGGRVSGRRGERGRWEGGCAREEVVEETVREEARSMQIRETVDGGWLRVCVCVRVCVCARACMIYMLYVQLSWFYCLAMCII